MRTPLHFRLCFAPSEHTTNPTSYPQNRLKGRNSRLIIAMCPTPYCCMIGHPPITSLDAVPDSAHIRSTGSGGSLGCAWGIVHGGCSGLERAAVGRVAAA